MAFIQQGNTVFSFAEFEDVVARDARLFQANEGLTQDVVEEALVRSTQRIIDSIRGTDWWKTYYIRRDGFDANVVVGQTVSVPAPEGHKIRARRNDFTDLTVFYALSEYLYPAVADFGNPDSAERQKLGFYNTKYRELFTELVDDGDWYDFDGDGTITSDEIFPVRQNLVRVR